MDLKKMNSLLKDMMPPGVKFSIETQVFLREEVGKAESEDGEIKPALMRVYRILETGEETERFVCFIDQIKHNA